MTYEPPPAGGAPQQHGAPQHGAPQYGAPQYGAPQYGAAQHGAPRYGAAPYEASPYGGAAQPPQSQGLAITALVLGIVAILTCWFPPLGGLVGIAAIVLGAIALRKRQSKGMSITGLITGALGLLASILVLVVGMLVATAAINAANEASQQIDEVIASAEAADATEHSVEYLVTVGSGEADVTYGNGASTSNVEASGEWSERASFTGQDIVMLSVIGDFTATDQELTCEIIIDGESVDRQEGTSAVSCAADTYDF